MYIYGVDARQRMGGPGVESLMRRNASSAFFDNALELRKFGIG